MEEYWSGLSCPSPGGLLNPGIKPVSLMSPALAGSFFTTSHTWEAHYNNYYTKILLLYSKIYIKYIFSRHWEYKNEQKEVCCLESSHPTKRYKAIAIGKATLSLYWKRERKLLLLTNNVSLCTAVYVENR